MPSRRLVLLAFLGVLPAILGFAAPELYAGALLWDVALVLLALLDRNLALGVRVEARRHPRGRLHLGVENRVVVRLKNLSARRAHLAVRDDVPDGFVARGETLEVRLKGFKVEERTYFATPPKRGKFHFGDLHLRSFGPLGLCAVERTVAAPLDVRVYPDMRGASRLLLATAARDLANLGLRRLRRDGAGSEFARLREYVQGDSMRDVDWKATARRRRPVTRVHETERSQTLILCVDAGRSMAARVDTLTKLDYAVNAALFLAFVAIRNGDRVGVVVFADGVRAFLPPEAGRRQYRRIVDALYGAEVALTFVDYQALFRELSSRARKRSLVAVFTDLLDEQQARSLVAPLHRMAHRHVPLCITLRDQGIEDLVRTRPAEVDDAYRQAVAHELLEEREHLKALIARDGVQLVDAPPSELTLAAVNRYLEVKRRGLL
ncbi:MAG: DUF58 domain-containing protein [Deltaproteobacteria bacterium]|nr:DUF58 domain-containing protein [Deltaproteobacteria bacterium]